MTIAKSISGMQVDPTGFAAGDEVLASSLDYAGKTSATPVKIKEIQIPASRGASTLRIVFSIQDSMGASSLAGRIYRNGVAVGTNRTAEGTYSEDISGWVGGDKIQLYGNSDGSTNVNFGNLQIKGIDQLFNWQVLQES
jgi:hypothetical protein